MLELKANLRRRTGMPILFGLEESNSGIPVTCKNILVTSAWLLLVCICYLKDVVNKEFLCIKLHTPAQKKLSAIRCNVNYID